MSETVLRASARRFVIPASISDCMAGVMLVDALASASQNEGSVVYMCAVVDFAENALASVAFTIRTVSFRW